MRIPFIPIHSFVFLAVSLATAFFVSMLPCFAIAATIVDSSEIGGDVQWSMENNPYVIEGDLIIKHGSTLMVGPGTKIIFADNAHLYVDGMLEFKGTQEMPVTMRAETEGAS